jgi:hypothetical protein
VSTSRARALVVTLLTTAATAATTLVAAPAQAAMPEISFAKAIERLAPYQAQSTCSPTVKPGTGALRAMVMKAYPGTRDSGITRACSIGGTSEHKEGRAWDWGVRYSVTTERAKAQAFLSWLFKTDKYGNRYANARRLGVQYVIWNRKIWGSYNASAGWRTYTGADPHTSHVHISLSWAGARKQTSFWTRSTPYNFPVTTSSSGGSDGGGYGGWGEGTVTASGAVQHREPTPLPQPSPVPSGAPIVDETLTLPATYGSGVVSKGVLQAGDRYRVTLNGIIAAGGGLSMDAECTATNADRTYRRQRAWVAGHEDWDVFDAYLNGYDVQGRPTIDNGRSCNTTNHVYTWEFTAPTNDKARLRYWDPFSYGDNTGKLVARIVRLGGQVDEAPTGTDGPGTGYLTTPASFAVDSASATGASLPLKVKAGQTYTVTMTGSFSYGAASADAECSTTATDSRWLRSRDFGISYGDRDLLDLKLGDGDDPISWTASGADCDGQTHTYTWRWTPNHDQPVRAFVYDTSYGDNHGEITVNVVPA